MIQSIQKVIKIGSSGGVTIPAKDLKQQNISIGDDVEVIVRPLRSKDTENDTVLLSAKKILTDYRQDFENLAKR
jgi:bifunctional DNA-binding transcriptional regulator/antitoxin component of YhaV-PrlF toxin-antitoxin module